MCYVRDGATEGTHPWPGQRKHSKAQHQVCAAEDPEFESQEVQRRMMGARHT